jgi:hypothetical protein
VINRVENELANTPRSQVERLVLIEPQLYFLGALQRQDIVQRFSVASVKASRDIALYKQLASKNLNYDYEARTYLPSDKFKRISSCRPKTYFGGLNQALAMGYPICLDSQ